MPFEQFQRDLLKHQMNSVLDRFEDEPSSSSIPFVALENEGTSSRQASNQNSIAVEDGVDLDVTRTQKIETADGTIWVDGNTLLCACPDCSAPMSIRIWLGLADCWACESCIELSAEQMLAAQQLLEQNRPSVAERITANVAPPRRERPEPQFPSPTPRHSAGQGTDPRRSNRESIPTARAIRGGISMLPAWFISFILHLILLLMLALIFLKNDDFEESITISTFISQDDEEGGIIRDEPDEHTIEDDLSDPIKAVLDKDEQRDLLEDAEVDAEQITKVDPNLVLPDLEDVKKDTTTAQGRIEMTIARDPRVRSEIVKKEGGTTLTEAAVSRGLRWLASVQNADGSWSLSRYSQSSNPRNQGDTAATSLALLPFLGANQTHLQGPYKRTVARGINWLIEHQDDDGDLRAIEFLDGKDSESRKIRQFMIEQWGMYAHGQATIVLVEAYALSGDLKLKEPAQRAVNFIQNSQHLDRRSATVSGGWRYQPGDEGDTSVLGWQLMALQSARDPSLGLNVETATLKLAGQYLDSVGKTPRSRRFRGVPNGSLYRYLQRSDEPTATMTAEALLCRMYLGWKRDDPRIMSGIKWLYDHHLPTTRNRNMYYWYYGTQVMHHYGGVEWEEWNRRMRDILVVLQQRKGKNAGSWSPTGFRWGSAGGRIYTTSLAICSLEVYYRHVPIFRKLDLD